MIGGAKVSGKLEVLENIVTKVNSLLIGGGMAATFLKVRGYTVGASLVEDDKLDYVENLITNARSLNVKLFLPQDVVVTDKLEAGSKSRTVLISEIPDGWIAADIGPKTIEEFSEELRECKTVVWNGPLGVFEIPQFAEGTRQLAQIIADLKTTTIIGGGSTAEAVAEMGLAGKMYHVSTGGGASLDFLAGKTLPGVAVLQDK
jgi:phosphoglycerate kinase